MNVLPARVEGNIAHLAGGSLQLARAYINVPQNGKVEIGVRPEDLTLSPNGEGLPVRIHRVDDIGRLRIARARLDHHDINIVVPEDEGIPADHAYVTADPSRLHVYCDGRLVEEAA